MQVFAPFETEDSEQNKQRVAGSVSVQKKAFSEVAGR